MKKQADYEKRYSTVENIMTIGFSVLSAIIALSAGIGCNGVFKFVVSLFSKLDVLDVPDIISASFFLITFIFLFAGFKLFFYGEYLRNEINRINFNITSLVLNRKIAEQNGDLDKIKQIDEEIENLKKQRNYAEYELKGLI